MDRSKKHDLQKSYMDSCVDWNQWEKLTWEYNTLTDTQTQNIPSTFHELDTVIAKRESILRDVENTPMPSEGVKKKRAKVLLQCRLATIDALSGDGEPTHTTSNSNSNTRHANMGTPMTTSKSKSSTAGLEQELALTKKALEHANQQLSVQAYELDCAKKSAEQAWDQVNNLQSEAKLLESSQIFWCTKQGKQLQKLQKLRRDMQLEGDVTPDFEGWELAMEDYYRCRENKMRIDIVDDRHTAIRDLINQDLGDETIQSLQQAADAAETSLPVLAARLGKHKADRLERKAHNNAVIRHVETLNNRMAAIEPMEEEEDTDRLEAMHVDIEEVNSDVRLRLLRNQAIQSQMGQLRSKQKIAKKEQASVTDLEMTPILTLQRTIGETRGKKAIMDAHNEFVRSQEVELTETAQHEAQKLEQTMKGDTAKISELLCSVAATRNEQGINSTRLTALNSMVEQPVVTSSDVLDGIAESERTIALQDAKTGVQVATLQALRSFTPKSMTTADTTEMVSLQNSIGEAECEVVVQNSTRRALQTRSLALVSISKDESDAIATLQTSIGAKNADTGIEAGTLSALRAHVVATTPASEKAEMEELRLSIGQSNCDAAVHTSTVKALQSRSLALAAVSSSDQQRMKDLSTNIGRKEGESGIDIAKLEFLKSHPADKGTDPDMRTSEILQLVTDIAETDAKKSIAQLKASALQAHQTGLTDTKHTASQELEEAQNGETKARDDVTAEEATLAEYVIAKIRSEQRALKYAAVYSELVKGISDIDLQEKEPQISEEQVQDKAREFAESKATQSIAAAKSAVFSSHLAQITEQTSHLPSSVEEKEHVRGLEITLNKQTQELAKRRAEGYDSTAYGQALHHQTGLLKSKVAAIADGKVDHVAAEASLKAQQTRYVEKSSERAIVIAETSLLRVEVNRLESETAKISTPMADWTDVIAELNEKRTELAQKRTDLTVGRLDKDAITKTTHNTQQCIDYYNNEITALDLPTTRAELEELQSSYSESKSKFDKDTATKEVMSRLISELDQAIEEKKKASPALQQKVDVLYNGLKHKVRVSSDNLTKETVIQYANDISACCQRSLISNTAILSKAADGLLRHTQCLEQTVPGFAEVEEILDATLSEMGAELEKMGPRARKDVLNAVNNKQNALELAKHGAAYHRGIHDRVLMVNYLLGLVLSSLQPGCNITPNRIWADLFRVYHEAPSELRLCHINASDVPWVMSVVDTGLDQTPPQFGMLGIWTRLYGEGIDCRQLLRDIELMHEDQRAGHALADEAIKIASDCIVRATTGLQAQTQDTATVPDDQYLPTLAYMVPLRLLELLARQPGGVGVEFATDIIKKLSALQGCPKVVKEILQMLQNILIDRIPSNLLSEQQSPMCTVDGVVIFSFLMTGTRFLVIAAPGEVAVKNMEGLVPVKWAEVSGNRLPEKLGKKLRRVKL